MKWKRWMALPIAGVAAIAIGVAAVEAAPSPSPSAATSSKNYAQVFVDKLAAILGISPSKTQDALKQAELQTVDQMQADGKITKAQADAMKARINAGPGLGPMGGYRGFRGGFQMHGLAGQLKTAEFNAVASALHMSTTDLQNALRSGKSLSDLESQQHVSDATVKAAMKDAAKGVLDPAVKAGTITQAQEDEFLNRVGTGKFGGFGFGHRFGGEDENEAPASPNQSPNQSPAAPAAYYSSI